MSKNLKDFSIYANEGGSIYLECEVCSAIVSSEAYNVQELVDKVNKHVCVMTEDKYKYNWDGELDNYYRKDREEPVEPTDLIAKVYTKRINSLLTGEGWYGNVY